MDEDGSGRIEKSELEAKWARSLWSDSLPEDLTGQAANCHHYGPLTRFSSRASIARVHMFMICVFVRGKLEGNQHGP